MERKKCIECGEYISENAEICPKCGVRQNNHTAEKIVGGLGAAVGAAGGAGIGLAGVGTAATAGGTSAAAINGTLAAAGGGGVAAGVGAIATTAAIPVVGWVIGGAILVGGVGFGITKLIKKKKR